MILDAAGLGMDIGPLELYAVCIDRLYSDNAGYQMEPFDSSRAMDQQNYFETGCCTA